MGTWQDVAREVKRLGRGEFIDCDCCGDVGAVSFRRDGTFFEGQKLICGCTGAVYIDDVCEEDATAYAYAANGCRCWERRNHNTRSRRKGAGG